MAKVLLVDDDEVLGQMYKSKLDSIGHNVDLAFDGEEALQRIEETLPDLIILDILMPKKNGFEVLEIIKAHPTFKDTPVVILTHLSEEEHKNHALEMGANDYIVKTLVGPEEVIQKILPFLSA